MHLHGAEGYREATMNGVNASTYLSPRVAPHYIAQTRLRCRRSKDWEQVGRLRVHSSTANKRLRLVELWEVLVGPRCKVAAPGLTQVRLERAVVVFTTHSDNIVHHTPATGQVRKVSPPTVSKNGKEGSKEKRDLTSREKTRR
jgi:hypothetical protein